jgi:hypothetical protein
MTPGVTTYGFLQIVMEKQSRPSARSGISGPLNASSETQFHCVICLWKKSLPRLKYVSCPSSPPCPLNLCKKSFSAKATRAEVANDYDVAFTTYIHAAKSFLHIYHTALPGPLREKSKSSAARCLDRAERIKLAKRDLAPVRKDIFSAGDIT